MSSVLADVNWQSKRRKQLVQMHDQGLTRRHIAKRLMMTEAAVARIIAEAKRKRKPK